MSALAAQLEAFERYLRTERRAADKTVETYLRELSMLASWLDARGLPSDATHLDLRMLRAFLAARHADASPATMSRSISTLRAFYRFLRRKQLATENPAALLRRPKLIKNLPTVLVVDEASELVTMPTDTRTTPEALRDAALLELLYGSGLRVSEAVGLDLDALDLDATSARVLGKGGKERVVPVGGASVRAIQAYLEVRHRLFDPRSAPHDLQAVFVSNRGKRLSTRWVQKLTKRYGALATGRADVHPHALRHSCATHLLDAGADLRSIQELLGHASLSTTQRYTHVGMDRLMETYAKAHPLARRRASS